ncbi:ABC transporter ATP-binding protein [Paenibacillus ehimensis]|uniref:ABC transporter ATP-binding protein n=1 Tax=Paenibacillus ehimensis TaxID=79264 RepID=A0ABT8VEL9_9BACL|nr:ABC transporter ATP-binding protein [Paenibacillus ehimensis]MDO3679393.1 ABC transporter ATP-binding protein [Paenibacillus ehimensis]MEC0207928.1 ABC transporter ATP-binding protein [Paenibacillus ehimensis]
MNALLEVQGLQTEFVTRSGVVRAVDGVDLVLRKGETLGVVGESGCGKSVTSMSIMGLLPKGVSRIAGGDIRYNGTSLLSLSAAELRKIRGNKMAMIFQEPMTSLNPVFKIGSQIAETVRFHMKLGKKEAWSKAVEMLTKVGIPRPEQIAMEYPHQLSGGMRQRVMIAMAMACGPEVLIADEPTTALDVTIQAQILDLMRELQEAQGTAVLLITHDLGVVAETCQRVVVMYAGQVVEETDVKTLFRQPKHPYTRGLLASLPQLAGEQHRLEPIPGSVPNPAEMPTGCRFAPRCAFRTDACDTVPPQLTEVEAGHKCRCLLVQEGKL